MKKVFVTSGFIILFGLTSYAQSWLDFRSAGSGDWDNLSNWEQYTWKWPFSFSWSPANRLPDSYTGRIISNVTIRPGHVINVNHSIIGASGSLNIDGSLTSTSSISGLTNADNFPLVNISGTLTINSFLNSNSLNVNPSGILNTSFSGSTQTQGWWYNTTTPGSVNLLGTLIWSASVPQIISTISPYNNLIIASNARTSDGNLGVNGQLRINNNSRLTISYNTYATINDLNIIPANGGLILESNSAGTASLIHTGSLSGSGILNVQRYISSNAWHLISVPFTSYNLTSLVNENTIDQNSSGSYYALRTLNESSGIWNSYPTNTTPSYNLSAGEGFFTGMSEEEILQFTGEINPNNQNILRNISNDFRGWNTGGNPFTSAMGITIFSDAGSNCFLSQNSSVIDQNDLAVYVYDPVSGEYKANSSSVGEDYIQLGQGYMVKAAGNGGNLVFNNTMQSHNNVVFSKKSVDKKTLQGITLTASNDEITSDTKLIFHEGMTYGLDPSWDIRGYGFNTDFHFYSRLVENNQLSYFVQCLPKDDKEDIIVPLGLDFSNGGEVIFSVNTENLPFSFGAYLEDREQGITTDLRKPGASYRVILNPMENAKDRFYFHTQFNESLKSPQSEIDKLKLYFNKKDIYIKGQIPDNTKLSIYDLSGRLIIKKILSATNSFQINLNDLMNGVYLIGIESGGNVKLEKLILY